MAIHWRLLRVALVLGGSLVSLAGGHTISRSAARKLVREALIARRQYDPLVRIDPFRYDYAPEFTSFMAWWPNPDGDPLIGYFAVNPWTGDVWDVIGCERITSPTLQKAQESIWKQSHLLPEAKGTLHEKSPACSAIERNVKLK